MATNDQRGEWNIYAKQLSPRCYGYPLWTPDPGPGRRAAREVELGDVGWLVKGKFLQLFNATMEKQEDQIHADVPEGFIPFDLSRCIVSGPDKDAIAMPPLCSQTIETFDVSGSAQATTDPVALAAAEASFTFKCTDNQGAMLIYHPTAYSTAIQSENFVRDYMREHFSNWVELFAKYGIPVKEQEIFFVFGTTKTARWAVTAFDGKYNKKQGMVSANIGSVGEMNMSVSISNQSLPQRHRKVGPSRDAPANVPLLTATDGEASAPAGPAQENFDQCIFIHYCHAKRRMAWIREFKAGAGPHELPPPAPDKEELDILADSELDEGDESEQSTSTTDAYNPVNHLLDYILENSDASVAIASDVDLYTLLKDSGFPTDIPAALASLKPAVEVDENGAGIVVVDSDAWKAKKEDSESARGALDPSNRPIGTSHQESAADAADGHVNAQGDRGDDEGEENILRKLDLDAQAIEHDGSVTALACSPDGRYAASGSEDRTVIIWNISEERMMHRFTAHNDTVSSLAFSPDNELLVSGSNDRHIILWTVATGQELKRLAPEVAIRSVTFTPDGKKLIAGAYDGSLFIWDTASYDALLKINKHRMVVTFIVFSPDGQRMATGGTESVCYLWEMASLADMKPMSVLTSDKPGMVYSAAFSPDGERIVTAWDDGGSRVFKCETGELLLFLFEHTGPVWSVAFSPDGKQVASGSSDSTVKVCDSYTGDSRLSLEGHEGMVEFVRFSLDGKYIVSAASDNTLRWWSVGDGALAAAYNEDSDVVTTIQFWPDGSKFVSGSHDGSVHIRPIVVP